MNRDNPTGLTQRKVLAIRRLSCQDPTTASLGHLMCNSRFPQNYTQILIAPHGIGSALGFTLRVLGLPLGWPGALYSHGGKAERSQSQLGMEPGCEGGWYAILRRFDWVLRCRVPVRFDYLWSPFCLQKEVGPGYSPEDERMPQISK